VLSSACGCGEMFGSEQRAKENTEKQLQFNDLPAKAGRLFYGMNAALQAKAC